MQPTHWPVHGCWLLFSKSRWTHVMGKCMSLSCMVIVLQRTQSYSYLLRLLGEHNLSSKEKKKLEEEKKKLMEAGDEEGVKALEESAKEKAAPVEIDFEERGVVEVLAMLKYFPWEVEAFSRFPRKTTWILGCWSMVHSPWGFGCHGRYWHPGSWQWHAALREIRLRRLDLVVHSIWAALAAAFLQEGQLCRCGFWKTLRSFEARRSMCLFLPTAVSYPKVPEVNAAVWYENMGVASGQKIDTKTEDNFQPSLKKTQMNNSLQSTAPSCQATGPGWSRQAKFWSDLADR